MRYLIYIFVFCSLGAWAEDGFVKVTTEYGRMRGRVQQTILKNRTYYSFRGIPYAAPPLGELRFLPPQAFHVWTDTRDALEYGSECPQIDVFFETEIHGDEDCLFINVFTPELPTKTKDSVSLKPVLVYIHGGGYHSGSGDNILTGPDFFMEEDVVLVTFNYRLGALGFLSLEDTEAPGNYGLKDQIEALRWVQRNIETFGGNPSSVTIFGQSAGGASTSLIMASHQSEDLIHKVISQSGTLVNGWAVLKNHKQRAFKLGELLGLNTTDSRELLDFFRTVPAYNLVAFSLQTLPDSSDISQSLEIQFPPAIEPAPMGLHAMFTTDPLELLETGEFRQIPLMLGYASQESIMFLNNQFLNTVYDDIFLTEPKIGMPVRGVKVPYDSEIYTNAVKTFREIYKFDDSSVDSNERFAEILSDTLFNLGVEMAAQIQTKVSKAPTYFYKFSFDGGFNRFKKLTNPSLSGASHADELCYLFSCKSLESEYKQLEEESSELKVIQKIVKLWTNFAKTGKPTPDVDEALDNVLWLPYTSNERHYINIDEELTMHILDNTKINKWLEIIDYIKRSQSKTSKSDKTEL